MKKIVIIFLTFFTLQGFAQEVSKQYDKIGKFNKGLAIVWKNGHCGILSQDGREIVKPTYDKIGSFGNDAIAYTTRDGKVGLLNMEGKVIVPNIYESIGGFKGSFAITRKNGLAGMINKQGKVLIENKYEKITIGKNNAIKAVKDGQEMMLDIKN
ncbi:MAG: WG repeat-containing protein [Chitinophagaceae bacterium]|nr:WG repeat-containing protein [Chitinophagaceae bacterium]MBL0201570.1 WG repeat-containing protein [Chitinophagaceae bacterium]